MKGFEMPNQEIYSKPKNEFEEKRSQLGGKEIERKNIFEKIYKSKIARMLTLAAALGIGGKFIFEKQADFHEPSIRYELSEKNRLELGELENKFSSKMEIPNAENKYVLHIAQIHGASSLEESIRGMEKIGKNLGYLIEKQRDVESLLAFLSEKYQIKDVFVEGTDKTIISFIEEIKSNIAKNKDGTRKAPVERWNKAISIFNFAKDKQEGFTDAQRAHLLYLSQSAIKNEKEFLFQSYERYQSGTGDVEQEYLDLFKLWQQAGISFDDAISGLSGQEKEMGAHELLKDDRIYIWGGAMKLYLEGKINAHPAETMEANQKAFAKYPGGTIAFTQEQLKDSKELEKLRKIVEEREAIDEKGNDIRENAAINLIVQAPSFQARQFSPLIYGQGHDFKNNIEKFNSQSQRSVGLMRIESKK
ncbi:MAG: hypothetical protein Q7S18_00625 [bacterium]|nr:hypothetical protein [bacterium]